MVNIKIRLIIVFAAKDGEALYSQQKQDWADCGSGHDLFIAKFRLKLKWPSWSGHDGGHHGQQKSLKCILGCNLKNDRMISVHFQGKPFNITVIQVYAPTSNAEEAEVECFYEDLQDLLELTPKKDVLFI